MTGTTRRQRMTGAEREEQILATATAEFSEQGYGGASMNAIAGRAGVTKPLLYRHFGSKDGLFLACQRSVGERLIAGVERAMRDAPPSTAMPQAVLDAIFVALEHDRRAWSILNDATIPATGPVAEAARGYQRQLARLAARGTTAVLESVGTQDPDDVDAAVGVWMGAVRSLVEWWLVRPDESAAAMSARCHRLIASLGRLD